MYLGYLPPIVLMLAISAVWIRISYLWLGLFLLALITGMFTGWIQWPALFPIAAFALATWLYSRYRQKEEWESLVVTLVTIVLAIALGLHVLPGFQTLEILPDFQITAQSGWSALSFEADKPIAGLFLLVAFRDELLERFCVLWRTLRPLTVQLLVGVFSIYLLGVLIGQNTLDISIHIAILLWLVRILFFTVIAEELLFRGVIQREILERLRARYEPIESPYIPYLSVLSAGTLFGIAHLGGGVGFAVLATLAGIVYGYGYHRTGRLEIPILTHLFLNTGHLLFLSYG